MITAIIDFYEYLPTDQRKSYLTVIAGDFPCGYVDHEIALDLSDEPHIMIQLAQEEMTPEQEKYLNRQEYIREYNARPGTLQPETTLEPWQTKAIHDILNNQVNKVPSNGNHTRFYTEPLAERQWDNEHHLIDIEGKEPMYGKLTITQCSTSDPVQVVKLSYNEVDELLTALLQWRMNEAKESHESMATQKSATDDFLSSDDSLNDLDDRPF